MNMKDGCVLRKSIVLFLLLVISLLTGCSGSKATDNPKELMEYCKETVTTLPEEINIVYNMAESENGKGLLIGRTETGTELVWESEDGETWKKKADSSDEFLNSAIVEAAIIDDKHMIVSLLHARDDINGQDAEIEYYIGTLGEQLELNKIDFGEGGIIEFQVVGDTVYGLDNKGKVIAYDYSTGGALKEFNETDMYVNTFCVLDDKILAIGPGAAEMYDIESGKIIEMDASFRKKLIDISDGNNMQFVPKLQYDSDSNKLYYLTFQGLYSYDFEQKEFQTVLLGQYHSFGTINNQVTAFSVESGGVIYISLLTKDKQRETYTYTQEPEGIKVDTGDKKQIVLYSLSRDSSIQDRVSRYNSSQDKIYVQYNYGVTHEDATTRQNAVNELNDELLEGKGPDILLLDGLAADVLIEKKLLADTSEFLKDDKLLSNISKPYQKGEEIYGIPMYFKLMAIHGDKDVVGSISDIQALADSLVKEQEKYPDALIIDKYRENSYVDVLYNAYYQDLFENKELNESKLSSFYEQLKKINNIASYNFTVEIENPEQSKQVDYSDMSVESNSLTEQFLETKDLRVSISGVTSEMDLARLYAYGREQGFEYSFFENKEQPIVVPNMVFGINANTKNMTAAEAFLKENLSLEAFLSYYDESDGFSINKDVIEENFKNSGIKLEVENGRKETVTIETAEVKGKQKKAFYELIAGLNQTVIPDVSVKEIIMEQAQNYVNGTGTLEQCTEAAMKKVNLYLKEQK